MVWALTLGVRAEYLLTCQGVVGSKSPSHDCRVRAKAEMLFMAQGRYGWKLVTARIRGVKYCNNNNNNNNKTYFVSPPSVISFTSVPIQMFCFLQGVVASCSGLLSRTVDDLVFLMENLCSASALEFGRSLDPRCVFVDKDSTLVQTLYLAQNVPLMLVSVTYVLS